MVKDVVRMKFSEFGDNRGNLVVINEIIDIPIEIKRLFYMYNSDADVVRGQHANRFSEFILINLAGSCKIKVKNGRGDESVLLLDKPHEGIYIPKMVWKDMYEWSSDSLLLVLTNTLYDESEYIRDYDQYVEEMNRL